MPENVVEQLPANLRKPRLRRDEAVSYLLLKHGLVVAKSSLAKWNCLGTGPEFQKSGPTVYYTPAALDEWAIRRLGPQLSSTAQRGAA